MFYLVYNLLSPLLVLPLCILHLVQVFRGTAPPFGERFGLISKGALAKLAGRPAIWLHAVSLGELIAARPLLKELRAAAPGHALVVSCSTVTGRRLADSLPELIDVSICFPFDFLPVVNHALKRIAPKLIIVMETEIWPNFTRQAARRGIPLVLANGRISDRSFPRYRRLSWFFRDSLTLFSRLCMQSDADRERIIAIGARPESCQTAGNLKYDIPSRQVDDDERRALRCSFSLPPESLIMVAGSTHGGEDQPVIDAYRRLCSEGADLFLVLAPRHPQRVGEAESLLQEAGIAWRRRSSTVSGAGAQYSGEVLLLDTIGELMDLYALSDLVFVGGSLVPVGGHNLLEPASVGAPSLFGPHMNNFREITRLVLEYGAGIQLSSPGALHDAWREMILCPELRRVLGQNGLKLMRDTGGATARHMGVIGNYL